jgi:hypothetical protein
MATVTPPWRVDLSSQNHLSPWRSSFGSAHEHVLDRFVNVLNVPSGPT